MMMMLLMPASFIRPHPEEAAEPPSRRLQVGYSRLVLNSADLGQAQDRMPPFSFETGAAHPPQDEGGIGCIIGIRSGYPLRITCTLRH